ncbi:MAG: pirin family protein, partial [Plesiomonas shigelloides]
LQVFQDMQLWRWMLQQGEQAAYTLLDNRRLWLQLVSGRLTVHGEQLENSDGLALWEENLLHIRADSDSEFLLFDLP